MKFPKNHYRPKAQPIGDISAAYVKQAESQSQSVHGDIRAIRARTAEKRQRGNGGGHILGR